MTLTADRSNTSNTKASPASQGDAESTHLVTPEDFDYARLLGFLGPRSVPSMEITRPEGYVRTLWLERGALRALGAKSGAPDSRQANRGGRGNERTGRNGGGQGGSLDATSGVTDRVAAQRASGLRVPPSSDTRNDGAPDALDFAGAVTLAIIPADGGLTIRSTPALPDAVRRVLVTRMFDLDADLDAFVAAVTRDRVLGPLVRRHARLRLPQLLDPFEGLVRAVLGQQVSVKGATTMVDRLVRRLGAPAPALAPMLAIGDAHAALLSFPRPAAILDAGEATLRSLGLTRAKAATIYGLARAARTGMLDCVALRTCDPDAAQAALVALPGIGPWTASYVRMRALGDRDAFPVTDLGVIKALDARGVPRDRHASVADRWRPWRAYATLHLWESLASVAVTSKPAKVE